MQRMDSGDQHSLRNHGQTLGCTPLLSVIDLGSNSFCLLQARCVDGQFEVVRRLRESIRLVAGIDDDGWLDQASLTRALECLRRFAEHTRGLPVHCVLAAATSAVRKLADPNVFLLPAQAALGHAIEVISSDQEGQLIWQGATHALPESSARRLVIDIGGGSTECIIGSGLQEDCIASVDIGCITTCQRYFADGMLNQARWSNALEKLQTALEPWRRPLLALGWQQAWGTSGSAQAIADISHAMGLDEHGISAAAHNQLCQRLLAAGHIEKLSLPTVTADNHAVVAGTLAILQALFNTFNITHMNVCPDAMREGMLWQLLPQSQGTHNRV